MDDVAQLTVPAGSVFVIGDSRTKFDDSSSQSFLAGPVDLRNIKGKTLWVWLSVVPQSSDTGGLFSRIRFERMFKRIH